MIRLSFLTLLVSLLIVGCKGPGETAATGGGGKGKNKELTQEERMVITSWYHDAGKEKILGNFEEAAKLFVKVIEHDPSNHAAMAELASILDYMGETNESLILADKAVELDKKNSWYRRLLAGILTHQSKFDEAADQFEELLKNDPNRIDDYYDWAAVLTYAERFGDAIKVYAQLEERLGRDPQIAMEKHRLYLQQNKLEEAATELEEYLDFDPGNIEVLGLLADLYLKTDQSEKAMAVYERIRVVDPGNGMVHLALADYYEDKGEREKSHDELRLAFKSQNLDIDTKAKILISYYGTTERMVELLPFAMELCETFVQTHPEDARPYSVYADYLYRENKRKEARDNYRLAVKYDPSKFVIWNQILILNSELTDFDAMATEGSEAMELFPAQPGFYLFAGMGHFQEKRYEEALEALEGGLPLVIDNAGMMMQFYSTLGDTYHAMESHEKSDEAYDQALAIEPNNTFLLNNYAYYLSERNTKLAKAAKMSARSNELQPGLPSFQDTYGWILFMQGEYDQALEWLNKALESGGNNSGVILEHYGDALFKLERADEAVSYWQKAKEAGGASEQIDRKIADRKLYE